MAIGIGIKIEEPETSSGYLSDESDFYGNESVKKELEARAASFDPRDWWQKKKPTLTEHANAHIDTAKVPQSVKLYNAYDGIKYARQLTETVQEFTERLPPATTLQTSQIPWICISNPYRKVKGVLKPESSQEEIKDEGPPDENAQWSQFIVLGGDILQELLTTTNEIEKKKAGQSKASISRAITAQRNTIVKKLLDAAVELHCTVGKWMLFCSTAEVNDVWSIIARATANNELGIASKVAPDSGGDARKLRLICIYTQDFTDMKDVHRVCQKLKDLGLVDNRDKTIYYKCDAYTYLGLGSGNRYDIKASLYNSKDVLLKGPEGIKGKKDGFFYAKKKGEGDWRPLENE